MRNIGNPYRMGGILSQHRAVKELSRCRVGFFAVRRIHQLGLTVRTCLRHLLLQVMCDEQSGCGVWYQYMW